MFGKYVYNRRTNNSHATLATIGFKYFITQFFFLYLSKFKNYVMNILGSEYNRKHKEFKKIIDNTLNANEDFNDINIDSLWTLSKISLNNNSTIVLNLKKDSGITESTREFLKKEFDKI